ncbi:MAG TPA: site-specific DNA-methyltransferase [Solirubrobacteraceae bacterium]|nr:site-specific DNA-methyltransferase [Solirubrobacteraceae bacterium]
MPELLWEGKYDASGKRLAPPRIALPFQTVETINESAQERQRTLDFSTADHATDWRNRLIWGDRKYVVPALLEEFGGQVDLIYIDPPFFTGDDFSFNVQVNGDAAFNKEPGVLEMKAYRDTWGKGIDGYLEWFYETVISLQGLLAETGSLIVHLDWHVGHYAKAVLDDVFGITRFRNEVVWHYESGGRGRNQYPRKHDVLLWYSKGDRYIFNPDAIGVPRNYCQLCGSELEKWNNLKRQVDEDGRVYRTIKSAGKVYRYYDDEPVIPSDVWLGINHLQQKDPERVGFPTQKPASLLSRIVLAHSNPDELVLDCFVGSGTTAAVAEKHDRRWIAADVGRFAVQTTRKRLLSIPKVRPFVVQNLGKYERQLWQAAEFGDSATTRTVAYRGFILDLYHAAPINGYSWLHGLKQGRMVHVGTVDAPVTSGDVKQIVAEFRKAVGTGKDAPKEQSVDILGWDFAFELNEIARQDAEKAGINLRLVRIPREVLEKRAAEQADVRFFELAALSIGLKTAGRKVTLTLKDFVIPLDDVPADVQKAVKHWSQWIDYWAVDWDNKDDTFHNEWQSFRTRQSNELELAVAHEYPEPGEHAVVVKVIDILGNDTTRTMSVKVTGRGA